MLTSARGRRSAKWSLPLVHWVRWHPCVMSVMKLDINSKPRGSDDRINNQQYSNATPFRTGSYYLLLNLLWFEIAIVRSEWMIKLCQIQGKKSHGMSQVSTALYVTATSISIVSFRCGSISTPLSETYLNVNCGNVHHKCPVFILCQKGIWRRQYYNSN